MGKRQPDDDGSTVRRRVLRALLVSGPAIFMVVVGAWADAASADEAALTSVPAATARRPSDPTGSPASLRSTVRAAAPVPSLENSANHSAPLVAAPPTAVDPAPSAPRVAPDTTARVEGALEALSSLAPAGVPLAGVVDSAGIVLGPTTATLEATVDRRVVAVEVTPTRAERTVEERATEVGPPPVPAPPPTPAGEPPTPTASDGGAATPVSAPSPAVGPAPRKAEARAAAGASRRAVDTHAVGAIMRSDVLGLDSPVGPSGFGGPGGTLLAALGAATSPSSLSSFAFAAVLGLAVLLVPPRRWRLPPAPALWPPVPFVAVLERPG